MSRNMNPTPDGVSYIKSLERRISNLERSIGASLYTPIITFDESDTYNFPPLNTTSTDFVVLYRIFGVIQQPGIGVRFRVLADAPDTTGEIRIFDGSALIEVWRGTVTAGFNGEMLAVGNLPDYYVADPGGNLHFEIQARRTAGTGAIRFVPLYAYGRAKV